MSCSWIPFVHLQSSKIAYLEGFTYYTPVKESTGRPLENNPPTAEAKTTTSFSGGAHDGVWLNRTEALAAQGLPSLLRRPESCLEAHAVGCVSKVLGAPKIPPKPRTAMNDAEYQPLNACQ